MPCHDAPYTAGRPLLFCSLIEFIIALDLKKTQAQAPGLEWEATMAKPTTQPTNSENSGPTVLADAELDQVYGGDYTSAQNGLPTASDASGLRSPGGGLQVALDQSDSPSNGLGNSQSGLFTGNGVVTAES